MKTTYIALIVACAPAIGSLSAEVDSTPDDAKSTEPTREHKNVETVVSSEDDFREQFSEFKREGWSIHHWSAPKTNQDGTVVRRWKLSRPPIPNPAPVDFSREHKHSNIVGISSQDLWKHFGQLQQEGWAIHSCSRVITNDDGTVKQGLKMSRPQATDASNRDTCVHNLYQLRQAIRRWALDNGNGITNRVTLTDLEWHFRNHEKFPTCPSEGRYSVHTVWDPPGCSIPGHRLMQPYYMWKLEHR